MCFNNKSWKKHKTLRKMTGNMLKLKKKQEKEWKL